MNGLNFLDSNVWLALVWERHARSSAARSWFEGIAGQQCFFCRFTQLTLLRLLTTTAVMGGDVKSMNEAWEIYDLCSSDERIHFLPEPPQLDPSFRLLTTGPHASPKTWADAYLAAFAQVSRLTLITFDRALASKTADSMILGG